MTTVPHGEDRAGHRAASPDDDPRVALHARRAELVARLAALRADHDAVVDASRGSNADDEHDPEGATIAFERAQVDALALAAEREVAAVDAALARVDAGGYGVCTRCGRPIDPARLEVRPTATTCVTC